MQPTRQGTDRPATRAATCRGAAAAATIALILVVAFCATYRHPDHAQEITLATLVTCAPLVVITRISVPDLEP